MWNDNDKKSNETEIKGEILNFIKNLKATENEFNIMLKKYSDEFSKSDKKQQDILHYIEFQDVSSVAAYRLVKELKKVREERREAEDNVNLLNQIGTKFTFTNKFQIKDIINSVNCSLNKRVYKTRYYSPQSLVDIANKRKE